jgi:hypothetical protein
MTKVLAGITMSVDRYITGSRPKRLNLCQNVSSKRAPLNLAKLRKDEKGPTYGALS